MLLAASVALLAVPATASAQTCDKVAARDGADTNAGTLASPYKTAQKAVGSLAAGQTACLRSGVYDEQNGGQTVVRFNRSDIALRSYPGERATVKGIVYVPPGSDRVRISDLDIDGRQSVVTSSSAPVGIQIMAADTVVERNDITNQRTRSCMILGAAGVGSAQRTIVRLNRFHDCGSPANGNHDHAIYFSRVSDAQVTDNVFTGSSAWAIHFFPDADRNYVARNVIDGNGMGVIFAGNETLSSDANVVERNLITNSTWRYNVEDSWGGPEGTGNVLRANCVFGGKMGNLAGADGWLPVDNSIVDPQYVDRAAGDLRLRAGSSCLAVVGQDTAALVQQALTGVAAPAPEPEPEPQPQPEPEPQPVLEAPTPAPVVEKPAPVVQEPAPVTAPAPVTQPKGKGKPKKATTSRRKARAKAKRKAAARKRRIARRASGRR